MLGLTLIVAGSGLAQERLYVPQLSPSQIHEISFDGALFVREQLPDGNAGFAMPTTVEPWKVIPNDGFFAVATGAVRAGIAYVDPNGVVLPVPNTARAGTHFLTLDPSGDYAFLGDNVGGGMGISVVDLRLTLGGAPNPGFLREVPGSALNFGYQTLFNLALLGPPGTDTLYVLTHGGFGDGNDTRVQVVDIGSPGSPGLGTAFVVPLDIGWDPAASKARIVDVGGSPYLAISRVELQLVPILFDGSLDLANAVNLRFHHDVSDDIQRVRDLYVEDTVDGPRAILKVESCGADCSSGPQEVLVVDLAPPFVSGLGEDRVLFTLPLAGWGHETFGDGEQLELSQNGAYLYLLQGGHPATLIALDKAKLLASDPSAVMDDIQLDTVSGVSSAVSFAVADEFNPTAGGPSIAAATSGGEPLVENDQDRPLLVSGDTLGGAVHAFLGSRWLSSLTNVTATSLEATVPALVPTGQPRLGVIDSAGRVGTYPDLKVVAPAEFLPEAIGYTADGVADTVTILNSASAGQVSQHFPTAQGAAYDLVSDDGRLLYVTGFRDATMRVHCIVADEDGTHLGVPCTWNEQVRQIGVTGVAPVIIVPNAAGSRLFVNGIWPTVDIVDTTDLMGPNPIGSVWISSWDDFPFRGFTRGMAVAGDWLFVANDRQRFNTYDPGVQESQAFILAADIGDINAGVASEVPVENVISIHLSGLDGLVGRSDGLVVHPDGTKLYFYTSVETAIRVFSIDPDAADPATGLLTQIGTIELGENDVRHLAILDDPDSGRSVLYSSGRAGTIDVIDLAGTSGCPSPPCWVQRLPSGAQSNSIRVGPSKDYVFAAAAASNAVFVVDARDPDPSNHAILTVLGAGAGAGDLALTPGLATEIGSDVTVEPSEGVQVTFDEVTDGGSTTVTSSNTTDVALPADFSLEGSGSPVFWDVNTTATFVGLVTVCFDYDDTGMTLAQEEALRLLHEETCSAVLQAAGAAGCDGGTLGTDLLTDWTEFTCTADLVTDGECAAGQEGTQQARYITNLPVDTTNNVICGRVGSFSQFVALVAALRVEIELPASINLKSRRTVPVSVLSTDTFDAADIDPATARLAGAAPLDGGTLEDVDLDGDTDLVLRFAAQDLGLSPGTQEVRFTAKLYDGLPVAGSATVAGK
ncbi:MAG TPA: hypothetical protein VMT16_06760 [Thermoanaerobaculia bacterium]|nr:hypothetical protein [Thermoanaerobaculia bacterium]